MRTATLCVTAILAAASVGAQPAVPPCNPKPTTYQDLWCLRIKEIYDARQASGGLGTQARETIEEAVQISDRGWTAFLLYAQARSEAVDARPVEEARTDKQLGAPASAAGSTSVVSKGAVPSILAFAVENGALTQTTSATTVTLRGNAVGWLDLLQNQNFIASYQDDAAVVRQLRRVSYSLTLNTDAGVASTPAPIGPAAFTPQAIRDQLDRTRQQLAGYSVRLAIWDQRDPRTAANRASIATLLDTKGVELLKSDRAFDRFFNSDEYLRKWFPDTVALLYDGSRPLTPSDIQRILYQRLEVVRRLMLDRIDGFNDRVAKALLAVQAYDKARVRLFQAMQRQPLVAFEYVNARTPDLPDRSTLRFIAEGQWGSRIDVTANAALTFQHAGAVALPAPADVGGRRDFQAAAQIDIPLGSVQQRVSAGTGIGTPVLGIAYLSQQLTSRAAVSFAGNTFTLDPGWIHVLQARLTLPVKGSGVKIPLSVSLANRTELLKEKEIRGHLGLTFDMDVLSSLIRR